MPVCLPFEMLPPPFKKWNLLILETSNGEGLENDPQSKYFIFAL